MTTTTLTQSQTASTQKAQDKIKLRVNRKKLAEAATMVVLSAAVGLCYITIYNIIMGAF